MTIKTILRCSVMTLALMPFGVGVAHAQSTAPVAAPETVTDTSDEIVVTGSRIRQNPLNQSSPVLVVDQSSLARTGLSSLADVLQRLPSASGGLNSKVNNSGNIGNPPDGGGVGAGSANSNAKVF